MKFVALLLFASFLALPAAAEPPTPASIERLFRQVELEKMVQQMAAQSDQMMRAGMEEAVNQNNPTPEMRERVAALQDKMSGVIRDELSFPKLKPLIAKVYADTFTQEEVDSLIAFYESPGGRALINKMPLVMNRTMMIMQQRMGPMTERMKKALKEAVSGK
jgi:hypothetical protein